MTFIAAMDNSGGSAGGVLDIYGQEWTEDDKMEKVNKFRLRMVSDPSFTKEKISHAILYKDSVSRGLVEDLRRKDIESILKIDSGTTERGILKVFDVDGMIRFALSHGCVGTKMRSVVKDLWDINAILDQQFRFAQRIADAGLIPIVEPEISIHNFNKPSAEIELQDQLTNRCRDFNGSLILKLTIPDVAETYSKLYKFNSVERIVGLSGGYSTNEACARLTLSTHMGASFSRALSEGLRFDQTDEEFSNTIKSNIDKIFVAGSYHVTR
tara:strand:+ start:3041 stop:3847 length:807 start_codon:yes stop_codon:yes gene_type:complete